MYRNRPGKERGLIPTVIRRVNIGFITTDKVELIIVLLANKKRYRHILMDGPKVLLELSDNSRNPNRPYLQHVLDGYLIRGVVLDGVI